jgi:hypothetical protein
MNLLRACTLVLLSAATAQMLAEETVVFQPGCLAKIYVCGKYSDNYELKQTKFKDDVPEWPIKVLPDAPVEVLKLKELPVVEATPLAKIWGKNKAVPSRLVESKADVLRGANFYAVEFEGYLQATVAGIHTIGIVSDDPIEVFVEGKSILKSDISVSPIEGPSKNGDDKLWPGNELEDQPALVASVTASQGSFSVSPNKWYHVIILAKQRWYPATRATHYENVFTTDLNRGAVFRATLTTPDMKSGPLFLQLPVVK